MNESAYLYIDTAESRLEEERVVAILLITGSIILLLCFAAAAGVPCIVAIEKSKREVWEIFFELPKKATVLLKNACTERLNLIADMQFETDVNQSVEDQEGEYQSEVVSSDKKNSDNDYTAIVNQSAVEENESLPKRQNELKNEDDKSKDDKK